MYCEKCGKQIGDDSVFCYSCGTKVKTTDKNAMKEEFESETPLRKKDEQSVLPPPPRRNTVYGGKW